MFETIVTKLSNTVRNVVTSVGAAARKAPWLTPAAILLFFLVL
jgi:hypothetical protein